MLFSFCRYCIDGFYDLIIGGIKNIRVINDPILRNALIKYQALNLVLFIWSTLLDNIFQLFSFILWYFLSKLYYPETVISLVLSTIIIFLELPILVIQTFILQDFINRLSVLYKITPKGIPVTKLLGALTDIVNRLIITSFILMISKYCKVFAILYLPLVNSFLIFDVLFTQYKLSLDTKIKLIETNIIYFYCYGLVPSVPMLWCIFFNTSVSNELVLRCISILGLIIFPFFIVSSYNSRGCTRTRRIYLITPIVNIVAILVYLSYTMLRKIRLIC
jgi:hypothetical protein